MNFFQSITINISCPINAIVLRQQECYFVSRSLRHDWSLRGRRELKRTDCSSTFKCSAGNRAPTVDIKHTKRTWNRTDAPWLAPTFYYARALFATRIFFQSFAKPFVSVSIAICLSFPRASTPSQSSRAINQIRLAKWRSTIRARLFVRADFFAWLSELLKACRS